MPGRLVLNTNIFHPFDPQISLPISQDWVGSNQRIFTFFTILSPHCAHSRFSCILCLVAKKIKENSMDEERPLYFVHCSKYAKVYINTVIYKKHHKHIMPLLCAYKKCVYMCPPKHYIHSLAWKFTKKSMIIQNKSTFYFEILCVIKW